ncbi:hypothetical protein N7474_001529 [Penicillium riverlandense]|uniref:uncharacterized protein n=1 Tax=Penicillium riverlandense TaxID=1903569 RepID=UPI0025469D45|nr:uncharacterized protein N7474_001529 [Penicillium riverlandense]KAJ5833218.1 hypothetical protein N7474_001529 [Penicillium riverlandense]
MLKAVITSPPRPKLWIRKFSPSERLFAVPISLCRDTVLDHSDLWVRFLPFKPPFSENSTGIFKAAIMNGDTYSSRGTDPMRVDATGASTNSRLDTGRSRDHFVSLELVATCYLLHSTNLTPSATSDGSATEAKEDGHDPLTTDGGRVGSRNRIHTRPAVTTVPENAKTATPVAGMTGNGIEEIEVIVVTVVIVAVVIVETVAAGISMTDLLDGICSRTALGAVTAAATGLTVATGAIAIEEGTDASAGEAPHPHGKRNLPPI